MLAAGLHGYLLRRTTVFEQALLIAGAFAFVYPDLYADLAGIALLAAVVALQRLRPAPQAA